MVKEYICRGGHGNIEVGNLVQAWEGKGSSVEASWNTWSSVNRVQGCQELRFVIRNNRNLTIYHYKSILQSAVWIWSWKSALKFFVKRDAECVGLGCHLPGERVGGLIAICIGQGPPKKQNQWNIQEGERGSEGGKEKERGFKELLT